MSAATSPSTGQPYGVKRVCTAWDLARRELLRPPRPGEHLCPAPRTAWPQALDLG
jgi:hypothetical protein